MQSLKSDSVLKKGIICTVSVCLFLITVFLWIYKLGVLPGLHGDEAWVGVVAYSFLKDGVTQLKGMTDYTGILEVNVVQLMFAFFGVSIFTLRVGGIILNAIGLIIISLNMSRKRLKSFPAFFMIAFGQSALLIESPRIAWEVNTFTVLFIAITLASSLSISQRTVLPKKWVFILLFVTIIASYNHIIFSTVPVSIFLGLMLYRMYYKTKLYDDLIAVFGTSICNIIACFFILKLFSSQLFSIKYYVPFLVTVGLFAETSIMPTLSRLIPRLFRFKANFQILIKVFLISIVICFLFIHGLGFFDAISGYKVLLQFYSYESPLTIKVTIIICAITYIAFIIAQLWRDLDSSRLSILPFLVISYLGVISLYVQDNSLRYYIIIITGLSLYSGYKLSLWVRGSLMQLICMVVFYGLIMFSHYRALSYNLTGIKPINFRIGNGKAETSAHFLPKEPLILFLKQNKAGSVDCVNEWPYFLNTPIQFYKIMSPWYEIPGRKIMVDYDLINHKSGYIYHLED